MVAAVNTLAATTATEATVGATGPTGPQGPPGPTEFWMRFGNGGGHGTSGTRYFLPYASDTGAGTSIATEAIPFDCYVDAIVWYADAVGAGDATIAFALCAVTLPSMVVATELAATVDIDVDLSKTDTAAANAVQFNAGDRVAVQFVITGTVSASQARPRAWIRLRPR